MDVRFKTPANFYICGQSQSGKTSLVCSMLYNLEELFHPIPTQVIYCFGQAQKEFNELIEIMPKIKLVEGFPDDLYDIVSGHTNSLVILDDLMCQCSNDQRMSDLFTRGSHHRGITVMYLTQNLFPPGKLSRTISLNSHYMIVFKKSTRFTGNFHLSPSNVSTQYKFPFTIFSRCHSKTIWLPAIRSTSTYSRQYAIENKHFTWREANCLC